MHRIKMFESGYDHEKEINDWLLQNPEIEVVSVSSVPMHDLYTGVPPQICSQWVRTTVVYKVHGPDSKDGQVLQD